MTSPAGCTRWRAAGTALLLVVTGGIMGVLLDRLLLVPATLEATPLTADAMTQHLGLSASESARVRSLLDSLHAEIATVVARSPDSLRATVREAQARIEAALPEHARTDFRSWIAEHHRGMVGRSGHDYGHGARPHNP